MEYRVAENTESVPQFRMAEMTWTQGHLLYTLKRNGEIDRKCQFKGGKKISQKEKVAFLVLFFVCKWHILGKVVVCL